MMVEVFFAILIALTIFMVVFLIILFRKIDRCENRFFSFESQLKIVEGSLVGSQIGRMSGRIKSTKSCLALASKISEKVYRGNVTNKDLKDLDQLCEELLEDVNVIEFYKEQKWM